MDQNSQFQPPNQYRPINPGNFMRVFWGFLLFVMLVIGSIGYYQYYAHTHQSTSDDVMINELTEGLQTLATENHELRVENDDLKAKIKQLQLQVKNCQ